MVEFRTGNILDADVDALVNTVNCVGVMGRGIALQFKNAYPDNFKAYEAACNRGLVKPGQMFVVETGRLSPRFIINFPTKRHWRGKSRIEDIESGLIDFVDVLRSRMIKSVAIPPLGSGLGGLLWSDVRPLIVAAVAPLPDVRSIIYEPAGTRDSATLARNRPVPKMTEGRAALVVLLQRYLNGLMDPFVTLLEAHKLLFFMQEAGQPLRLMFRKATYGPYAENLRHVLNEVEGHLIAGYGDGGDNPTKALSIIPGAYEEAARVVVSDAATRERFDRVAKLIDGFETPYGMELLATVYWAAQREGASNFSEVRDAVHGWSERKRQFASEEIKLAYRTLIERGWLNAKMPPLIVPRSISTPKAGPRLSS
ncbi:macro domain-containing protein [Mesorhizobium sp. C386A]|uniref:type II toxin-antitoxin system antitoxin DNA ADP-ribosyl glycohydrolase DarG n=1 Tax=unclassified Mesorhizobium TaxID=325217 RepID=UPI0003CE48F4|nr:MULTISPECIES: macro domain-containing protein [unclassified Mesorhizobium]ESY13641.1 Appr-1-p processing protein [Mesorhizobium sp. LNJC398B00]ESY38402.1 Appr-1-p processing protein [Mesorhizobium sp. LNJC386A00]